MGFRWYWSRAAARAFTDTLALMGWGSWRLLALRSGIALAAVIALLIWAPTPIGSDEFVVRAFLLGATIGAFLLLFMGHFIVTPHKLDAELREQERIKFDAVVSELREAKEQLCKKQIDYEVRRELEAAYEAGKNLQTREQGMSPGQWRQKVIEWFSKTEAAMEGRVPQGEVFMFKTICDTPQSDTTFDHCAKLLEARLIKLRQIISRLPED